MNLLATNVCGVSRQLVMRNLGTNMMELHHKKPLLCVNYHVYAAGCAKTKAMVY